MFPPDDDDDAPSGMGGGRRRSSNGRDLSTSHGRFWDRLDKFKRRYDRFPRSRHLYWWLFHNLVAHIAIGVAPVKLSFKLHDWTSDKLNLKGQPPTAKCARGEHTWNFFSPSRPERGRFCIERGCHAVERGDQATVPQPTSIQ